MSHQLLDLFDVEADFFAHSKLYAIGSSLPGYSLCSLLNNLFAIHLVKEPDIEIARSNVLAKSNGMSNLFEEFTDSEEQKSITSFQLFRYAYDCKEEEDISLLIYGNRNAGLKLIPELPNADFLILIQDSTRIKPESDIRPHLKNLRGINWVIEIDPKGLRSRSNLLL